MKKTAVLFIILLFWGCAARQVQVTKVEKPPRPITDLREVHKGLTGHFIFYISKDESDGDLWLYNMDSNSKWQITSKDDASFAITSFSPSFQYVVYQENILYDIKASETVDFYTPEEKDLKLPRLMNVNWSGDYEFYFLSSTNARTTNIFLGRIKDNECFVKPVLLPETYLNQQDLFCLSLSFNCNLLAFISRDEENRQSLFLYDLSRDKIKKMVWLKGRPDLLWSERNDTIFYYEDSYLYSINLKGEKNLVVSEAKSFSRLYYDPVHRYKFFYINSLADYSFVSLKNMDYVGLGDFLFNALSLKDLAVYPNPDLVFFDNKNNEIMSYNRSTKEIKKIIQNAALFRLSP